MATKRVGFNQEAWNKYVGEMTYNATDYLVERRLGDFLLRAFPHGFDWQVKIDDSRRRYDFLIYLNGKKTLVEFDGFGHYTKPSCASSDKLKTAIAEELGYRVIRVPYYIQMREDSFQHLFRMPWQAVNEQSKFPHGFIETEVFPSHFGVAGAVRFYEELISFPDDVRKEVILSLEQQAKKYHQDDVFHSFDQIYKLAALVGVFDEFKKLPVV
jgi:very-short-patch-repair endonuclease